ncbi:MAG: DUF4177 domain-containing protein [Anaerolineae bacterium]|jgi:hypothetical protein|nr:DUF4177 domain-containing protein [Anaerolineae bacterium]
MPARWEYLVVYLKDSKVAEDNKEMDVYLDADAFTEKLNKYGQAGWELVAFTWEPDGAKAALKRPARSDREDVPE